MGFGLAEGCEFPYMGTQGYQFTAGI